MGDSWVVENLQFAFELWNKTLAEIWGLVSQSPQSFKGGDLWQVVLDVNGALQGIGYALIVVFAGIAIYSGSMSFRDLQRPEHTLKYLVRFVMTKAAITYNMTLLTLIYDIAGGATAELAKQMGSIAETQVALPDTMAAAISDIGFLASVPLWIVTLLGCLFVAALSVVMLLTVYGRVFRIYMFTALSPLPLASFAGEQTAQSGKTFLRSYLGVCLEGAIVVFACIIFSKVATLDPVIEASSTIVQVWAYLFEVVFNLLILVGTVKAADRITKEVFGL